MPGKLLVETVEIDDRSPTDGRDAVAGFDPGHLARASRLHHVTSAPRSMSNLIENRIVSQLPLPQLPLPDKAVNLVSAISHCCRGPQSPAVRAATFGWEDEVLLARMVADRLAVAVVGRLPLRPVAWTLGAVDIEGHALGERPCGFVL
jgi:hypothetical protein